MNDRLSALEQRAQTKYITHQILLSLVNTDLFLIFSVGGMGKYVTGTFYRNLRILRVLRVLTVEGKKHR